MKEIKNYILVVDSYRRPERRRNTAGRYRVGAKTREEAVDLLQAKIGFGSIRVYYQVIPGMHDYDGPMVGYKEVVRLVPDRDRPGYFRYEEPRHATAPIKNVYDHSTMV